MPLGETVAADELEGKCGAEELTVSATAESVTIKISCGTFVEIRRTMQGVPSDALQDTGL